jgi:hypothetical protein
MHRHRQLHLWITEHDYLALRSLADERKETLSCVIRKLIKLHRPDAFTVQTEMAENTPALP